MSFSDFNKKILPLVGILGVLIILTIGISRAYTRGANDFSVFYEAWKLVLSGNGLEIYRSSPDRFLYCPGFAWILSPFALFSRPIALGIWCLLKAGVTFFIIRKFSRKFGIFGIEKNPRVEELPYFQFGIISWAFIIVARPILIDLEYGQVNLLILGSCVWAMLCHFEDHTKKSIDFLSWFTLGFAAISKLYPLPLLIVPWITHRKLLTKKRRTEQFGAVLGVLATLVVPIITLGVDGLVSLFKNWQEALLSRGLPLESHNQSFIALLHHYLSGNPTWVRSEGMHPLLLGGQWLSVEQIVLLSLFWTVISMGFILGWLVSGSNKTPLKWIAVLIGLLIVPSHLVWKPYFVMSLPLAIFLVQNLVKNPLRASQVKNLIFLLVLFVGINLSGFDFVGHNWGAHLEAGSILLFIHLLMLIGVANAPVHSLD